MGVDTSGDMYAAKVDGVTGRLLMNFSASSGATPLANTVAKRDSNRVTASLCVDSGGTIQGILLDSNRYIFVSG